MAPARLDDPVGSDGPVAAPSRREHRGHHGEADLATEAELDQQLGRAVTASGPVLVLDLTGLTFASCRAVDVMVHHLSVAACHDVQVSVAGADPMIAQLWELLQRPIPLPYPTLSQAVEALRRDHRPIRSVRS